MFFIGIIPAIIFCIGTFFMPRSPRWLATKGKLLDAKKILLKFHNPVTAENALQEIQRPTLHPEKFIALFKNKSYRKLLFIGIALGIFQQFFGINVVMYYGPFIFEKAGFHSASSDILLTFYLGVVNTLLTIITGLIIDRFGRRKLLIMGSIIAGCSLFTLSFLFHLTVQHPWQGTCMFISMVTFIIGYCISVGSLFWLIISEIFPLSIRGQAMSIATAIQWLANFVVSLSFLSLLNTIGASITFALYASVCGLAVIFTYFYVPETKRASLEDIEINNLSNHYSFGSQKLA
jgi:sugar porter (SP) family MFS transporter